MPHIGSPGSGGEWTSLAIRIATIGFTKKSLSSFVGLLRSANVAEVLDTRLRPNSQLSGFAKSDDLAFILKQFAIAYRHDSSLAPTDELLRTYRSDRDWISYEAAYRDLIRGRGALRILEDEVQSGGVVCLLCSEHEPTRCHRRVLAEMYSADHPGCDIMHLP
jgi:uncharacterized protein (DUF488 family)